jgi:hypothetical protein
MLLFCIRDFNFVSRWIVDKPVAHVNILVRCEFKIFHLECFETKLAQIETISTAQIGDIDDPHTVVRYSLELEIDSVGPKYLARRLYETLNQN